MTRWKKICEKYYAYIMALYLEIKFGLTIEGEKSNCNSIPELIIIVILVCFF